MSYDAGKRLQEFLSGKISSKVFAAEMAEYLESPEWRRIKAARAAEDLKAWRAGRERLLELIKEAQDKGFDVQTRLMPLKDGHDSLFVRIDGGGHGFPSFFHREIIEEMFGDILKGAIERRAANNGLPIHDHARVEADLEETAGHMEQLRKRPEGP